jgi:23S rRNA pseudouridine2605 synthase
VEKKYLVQVAGVPSQELLDKIRRGITLAEGKVHAKRVDIRSQHKQSAVLEMILDEGKNREIRRMLARLGHKVHQLKRVGVGKLSLGNLLPSQWRQLTWTEIEALRHDAIAAVGPIEAGRLDEPPREGRPGREGRPARGPAGRPQTPRAGQGAARGPRTAQGNRSHDGNRPPAGDREPRRPAVGGPRRPRRRPGKASAWRKPRGG